jgi:alpha-beta hydrolase superfamily lysophospholipase
MIDNCRDAIIGRDPEKFGGELITVGDADGNGLVRETTLFEHYRNLVAIWCRPVEKINHVLQYRVIREECDTGASSMQTDKFRLQGPDQHTINGTHWQPDGPVRGVIQLFHGLGEHRARYARFAGLATARGLAVIAHDHRGHGPDAGLPGHFSDASGWPLLIDDGLQVNDMIGDRYAGLPVVLLGHSMGSYLAQSFAIAHEYRLTGLILSGSTWPGKLQLFAGRVLARMESWRIGIRGKSALLDKLGFGNFNRPFAPARTEFDWLSRDAAEVDAYIADPLCGGPYTCGLWIDLLGGLRSIASDVALQKIRSELPVLLTGGSDDPVGGEKGITELAMHYARSGHNRLTIRIYPEGRHEMFNETNRAEFTADVLDWIEKQLPG